MTHHFSQQQVFAGEQALSLDFPQVCRLVKPELYQLKDTYTCQNKYHSNICIASRTVSIDIFSNRFPEASTNGVN